MKDPKVIVEAIKIGNDSYELMYFKQLKKTASKEDQVKALKQDQDWQQDHLVEVSGRIDKLVDLIEDL